MQGAVTFGLLLRGNHGVEDFRFRLLVAGFGPGATQDQVIFSRITGSPSGQASDLVLGR